MSLSLCLKSFIIMYPVQMSQVTKRNYDLENRLIEFAVMICNLTNALPQTPLGEHINNQLLRSGTSAAPNYGEAHGAESRKDFIHKMRICLKELRETYVWLRLIERLGRTKANAIDNILQECNELISIFATSIKTASSTKANP